MDDNAVFHSWLDLPFALDEDCWGELDEAVEEGPGVYYVRTVVEVEPLGRELYAVTAAATPSVISPEVLARGVKAGDVWVFLYTGADSVFNLVKYELTRYRTKRGLPLGPGDGSLYCAAVYCAEYFPWYFGGTIPPRETPFGLTVRVRKAGEGLFFLETDQCRWVLAVSFPIWDSELSEAACALGTLGDDDLSRRVEESRYLFFPRERCAPALYELLDNPDHKGLKQFVRSKLVLEAHLWERFPAYAMEHNVLELSGRGEADLLENLLRELGAEHLVAGAVEAGKREQRVKNCIRYSKELAGQELLLLPE